MRDVWTRAISTVALTALGTCANPPPERTGANTITLSFESDAPAGGESLTCFGFDASTAAGRTVHRIVWSAGSGNVVLHHAALYAYANDFADGPFACDGLPAGLAGMHIFAPGNPGIELPGDTGLLVRTNSRRFVVQTHAIRVGDGPPNVSSVRIEFDTTQPAHTAAFIGANASVAPLPPHEASTGGTRCRVAAPAHVMLTWPHMHLAGREFHADVLHTGGATEAIVDVVPWNFAMQSFHPAAVDLAAGDVVETHCTWMNATESFILPGPRTVDEMCNLGLLVWPAESARWDGECP